MKHSIFTHSLFALCFLAAGYCTDLSAQAKPAANADAKKIAAEKAAAEKKAQAEAAKKEAAARQARLKNISDFINSSHKRKLTFVKRIEFLKDLLKQEEYQNCAASRLRIYNQIISYCFTPGWTSISLFNYYTADVELPPVVEAIFNDKGILDKDKIYAYEKYVEYLAGKDRHADAEKVAKSAIALFEKNPEALAKAYANLAKAYRYQDRYDDAIKTTREAIKHHPKIGTIAAANIAKAFGKKDVIKEVWKAYPNVYDMLVYYTDTGNTGYIDDEIKQIAYDFAVNEENKVGQRLDIAARYFMGDNDKARKVRENLKEHGSKLGGGVWSHPIFANYRLGGYEMVNELSEFYAGSSIMGDVRTKKIQVISLGASNREADGAKLAAEFAKEENISEVDRMRFKFYEAILSGKSTDDLMKNTTLTRKEQSQVYLSAARHCLLWLKSDLAEKYAKIYESFFAEKEDRVIAVKYFDEPVKNITAWRKIHSQLEKQYCDIPYRGSMAFLETDVATGNRGNISVDKEAEMKKYLELTTLCDRYGIHIFLRAEDENARKIEQGFARGYGCEMYFAPGYNQPYTCMGSDPVNGITFQFHTTYNNLNHTRLVDDNPQRFHSEVEFTDNDYVLHLFFSWDLYYNKLPAKGTDYRFDTLAWGPAGGFSWGGSQGIHSAGAWGSLRFNLTDKQLNEIRKEIIFKSYKGYQNVSRDPGTRENLFQCWADPGIGDPEFYQEYVRPLEQELAGYAQKVKVDMTDAEVADVYVNALPKMKGLAHEVDQLRRKYLAEKLLND